MGGLDDSRVRKRPLPQDRTINIKLFADEAQRIVDLAIELISTQVYEPDRKVCNQRFELQTLLNV